MKRQDSPNQNGGEETKAPDLESSFRESQRAVGGRSTASGGPSLPRPGDPDFHTPVESIEYPPVVPGAYDQSQAVSYDRDRFTTMAGRVIHEMEVGELRSAIGDLPEASRVLEVGCGTGRLLESLASRNWALDGVDGSAFMLEQCRNRMRSAGYEWRLELGDAASLPYETGTFDFVYSIRLLNQTGNERAALAVVSEIVRVMKPSGRGLIEFGNHWRPARALGYSRGVWLRPKQVYRSVASAGARARRLRGAFFVGMSAYHAIPQAGLPVLEVADRFLARCFPRLASRCYLTIEKGSA